MSMFKKFVFAAVALLSVTGQANADVVNYSFGTALASSLLETFDELPVGATNTSFSLPDINSVLTLNNNAQIVQGTTGTHAAPYYNAGAYNGLSPLPSVSSPDASPYVSVYTGGTATFSFNKPINYFGMEWGSVDTYNYLSFYNGSTLLETIGGTTIIGAAGLTAGNQGSTGTIYANFTSLQDFTKVVASSTGISYEFDNVRVGNTPLPASLPMFVAAMMVMGAFGLRNRKGLSAAA